MQQQQQEHQPVIKMEESTASSAPAPPTSAPAPSTTTTQVHQSFSMNSTMSTSNDSADNGEGPAKRHAKKGQWQTPPVGQFFPSAAAVANTVTSTVTGTGTTAQNNTAPNVNVNVATGANATTAGSSISVNELSVPNSSDDYAKALQEAYRRGAEAAQALSRSQLGGAGTAGLMPMSVNPFNFNASNPSSTSTNVNIGSSSNNNPANVNVNVNGNTTTNSSSIPSTGISPATATATATTTTTTTNVANPLSAAQMTTNTATNMSSTTNTSAVAGTSGTSITSSSTSSTSNHPMATSVSVSPPVTTTTMGVPTPLSFTTTASATTQQAPSQQQQHVQIQQQQHQHQQMQGINTTMNGGASAQPNMIGHGATTTTTTTTTTSGATNTTAAVHVPSSSNVVPIPTTQISSTANSTANTNINANTAANNPVANSNQNNSSINTANNPVAGTATTPRSVSLPDMSTYAAKANDEEAKRLKRLARNRASARLRRLRKKNLVESYEAEVGVLEASLTKLRAHRWGVGIDSEALLEALSMDRGQQKIDSAKRKELITSILSQQKEQVQNVMDCQLENMVLGWIARQGDDDNHTDSVDGDVGMDKGIDEEKTKNNNSPISDGENGDTLDSLAAELNSVLKLTPDQKKQLVKATEGVEEERKAIEVVDTSLSALLSNPWLMNNGIEECMNQFTSIMNPTQMSKFMLWADHNAEAIDQLDYVNAPPANAQPATGPTFVFGIDDAPPGDDN